MRARWFTSDSLRSKLLRKLVHFVLHRWDVTDGGERVTPARPNDCYVAHLSIYDFATTFTRDKTILDAGCGTGYGTNYLLEKGLGARVQGVDISSAAIHYCRRHYRNPRLNFKAGNLLDLEFGDTKFDLVFASNVLEHVPNVDNVLDRLTFTLSENGTMLIAVPPVLTKDQLLDNFRNPYHLNNSHPKQWAAKLERLFEKIVIVKHGVRPGILLDFGSEEPSKCVPADFVFTPVAPTRLGEELMSSLTLIIIAYKPRRSPLPPSEVDVLPFDNEEVESMWSAAESDRRKVFSATGRSRQYDDRILRRRIYPVRALPEPCGRNTSQSGTSQPS